MAKKFTEEQQLAIDTRDRTLLVSAAAGSGKTATLVERVVESICDKDENAREDIGNMLIVTFTKAAAAELRERIGAKLKERLREDPENVHLKEQVFKYPSARISTIDSFYNEILRDNTEKLGISPSYRIADPIEARILSRSVLFGLIEAAFNGELADTVCTAEEFLDLSEVLTGTKSDAGLEDAFSFIYEKTDSLTEGIDILKDFTEVFEKAAEDPIDDNKYVKFACRELVCACKHYKPAIDDYADIFSDASNKPDIKCRDIINSLKEVIDGVLSAGGYSEMQSILSGLVHDTYPGRGRREEADIFSPIRAEIKDVLDGLKDSYFTCTEDELRYHFKEMARLIGIIHRFMRAFSSHFFEEKRRRGMLEHSDVARLTYMSLYENGKPSELAVSIRNRFSSVYVDEYQDVNALQGAIFDAVSTDTNRFMVGDIKQSIYCFRSAKPDIFADMKGRFKKLGDVGDYPAASIFMSKNFRCDEGIIDFVNDIFDPMFGYVKKSIGYDSENDMLKYAKVYGEDKPPYRVPEICLFGKKESKDYISSDDGDEESESIYSDISGTKDMPPIWVANKIKELIANGRLNSGEPIRPKDITVILRNGKNRAGDYAKALSDVGIRSVANESASFFFNAEVQLAVCLLSAIDNPLRDIYLAGLMCSPLYGFTADEMFFIKEKTGKLSLWQSLTRYAEEENGKKASDFIREINKYREMAEGMPVDALIQRLYRETGLLAHAKSNGKRENLMLLYNFARKFEASSFKGLHSFISYINTVIESGASIDAKSEPGDSDAVMITTVHSSKGLEYPIVFLADIGNPLIKSSEKSSRIMYSDEYGMAFDPKRTGGFALIQSPVKNIILGHRREKITEEELRVYYVALTRARERLYLVGVTPTQTVGEYLDYIERQKKYQSPYTMRLLSSFADILMMTGKERKLVSHGEFDAHAEAEMADASGECPAPVLNTEGKEIQTDGELYRLLKERFDFVYPDKYMTELPEKRSVSRMYPTVLDGTEDEEISELKEKQRAENEGLRRAVTPRFISEDEGERSAKMGIATHLVLQFCSLMSFQANGTDSELARLEREGFLSKSDIGLVRRNEIELFRSSSLLSEMIGAKKLHRELRFNCLLPAVYFSEDEERRAALNDKKILLQGVIDCIIEDEDGELHLVDYKTDRLSKQALSDSRIAKEYLTQKHSLQLTYYALAVKEMFGKAPKSVRIYSLPLGKTVDIELQVQD